MSVIADVPEQREGHVNLIKQHQQLSWLKRVAFAQLLIAFAFYQAQTKQGPNFPFCYSIICVYLFFSVFMVLLNDALDVHLWPLQCISMAFQYLLWVQLWKMLKAHEHGFKGCIGYYGNGVEFERNQCTLMVLNTHKDTNSFWTKCSTKWKNCIISLYNSCQYFVA